MGRSRHVTLDMINSPEHQLFFGSHLLLTLKTPPQGSATHLTTADPPPPKRIEAMF